MLKTLREHWKFLELVNLRVSGSSAFLCPQFILVLLVFRRQGPALFSSLVSRCFRPGLAASLSVFLTCRALHPFNLMTSEPALLWFSTQGFVLWGDLGSTYFININFQASNCSVSGFKRRQWRRTRVIPSLLLSWPLFSCCLSSLAACRPQCPQVSLKHLYKAREELIQEMISQFLCMQLAGTGHICK